MFDDAPTDIQVGGAQSRDAAKGSQDDEQMKARIRFNIQQMVQNVRAHSRNQEQSAKVRDVPPRELRERVRRFSAFAQAWEEPEGEAVSLETINAQLEEMRNARSRELRETLALAHEISMATDVTPSRAPMEATGEERRYEISEAAGAASSHVPHEAGRQTVGAGRQRRVLSPPAPDEPSQPLPKSVRTLLVRNVPMAWGQEDLLAKWPPDGSYDYLYIPYNLSKDSPLGIAYINFVSYEDAAWFHKKWHGRFLSRQDGNNPLDIAVAKIQGLTPNLARIKKAEIRKMAEVDFLPVLLEGKRRMEAHEVIAEWRRVRSLSESGPSSRRFQ